MSIENVEARYKKIKEVIISTLGVTSSNLKRFRQLYEQVTKDGAMHAENFVLPVNMYINWILDTFPENVDPTVVFGAIVHDGEFPYDTPEVQIMAAFLVYFRISYRILKDAPMPVMPTMLNENAIIFLKKEIFRIEHAITVQLNDIENIPVDYFISTFLSEASKYGITTDNETLVDAYQNLIYAVAPSETIYGEIYRAFISYMPDIDKNEITKLKCITSKAIPKKTEYFSCKNLQAMNLNAFLLEMHANEAGIEEKTLITILKKWFEIKPFDFINKSVVDDMRTLQEFNLAFGHYIPEFKILKDKYS